MQRFLRFGLLICCTLVCGEAFAERKESCGEWEVHYSLFNSTFLTEQVAERYQLVRASNRAILTVSVLDPEDQPVRPQLIARFVNPLSQTNEVDMQIVEEGEAVYALGSLTFTDGEFLRFNIELKNLGESCEIKFTQTMYRDS